MRCSFQLWLGSGDAMARMKLEMAGSGVSMLMAFNG